MFSYSSEFVWSADAFPTCGAFVAALSEEIFLPVGEVNRCVRDSWQDDDPVDFYYIPAEPEVLDTRWLKTVCPGNAETLARWANEALAEFLKRYKDDTEWQEDFADGVSEVFGSGTPPGDVTNTEDGIYDLLNKEGIPRLITPTTIHYTQPLNLFQAGFSCSCQDYFGEHGFGFVRKGDSTEFIPYLATGFELP